MLPTSVNAKIKEVLAYLRKNAVLKPEDTKKEWLERNQFEITWSIPTQSTYRKKVYEALVKYADYEPDVSVGIEPGSDCYIKIVIEGYSMPVNVDLNVHDNIFDPGDVKLSIWINDHVAKKV